jgi:3-dehydroquinate synthase
MQFPLKVTEERTSTVCSGETAWKDFIVIASKIQEHSGNSFILVDENTEKYCLPVFLSMTPGMAKFEVLRIKPGESSKSKETAAFLWDQLAAKGADRTSLLVNLGGGVVCDVGAFVASTFKRGIPCINIPTTLIAMTDAAIGGKTAINLNSVKNTIGTFYLPEATIIFPGFLKTLDQSEIRSGLAEIFKIGLVADRSFWEFLQRIKPGGLAEISSGDPFWEEVIQRAALLKCTVVEKDFYDRGARAILNFGHTFGHAFETLSHYPGHLPVSHGMAVAQGIICACFLSQRLSGLNEKEVPKIVELFLSVFGSMPVNETDIPEIIRLMEQDKKIREGIINFTLIRAPGEAVTGRTCSKDDIYDSLLFYMVVGRDYHSHEGH